MQQSDHDLLVRIDERVTALIRKQDDATKERNEQLAVLDGRLETLETMAHRYKGAFALVLGIGAFLGAVIGLVIAIWDKLPFGGK